MTKGKDTAIKSVGIRPRLKKTLFSCHRVTIIVASREAAKYFFFNIFFSLYRNYVENAGEKKSRKCGKNVSIRHL